MRRFFSALIFVSALLPAGPAGAQTPLQLGDEPLPDVPPQNRSGLPVDLELVLLADSTGSIDDREIFFQRRGYADAILHPDILSAISLGHERKIAITYVEWGDASSQEVVVPWTIIDGQGAAANFAEALMETPRRAFGRNAIGSAIFYAHLTIESNNINGFRRVIDISGDSANSWGGVPLEAARQAAIAADIVINGLAILCRDCSGRPVFYDLEEAYERDIIGGPAAFVVTADDMESFADAVRKKLLLEIAAVPDERTFRQRLAQARGGAAPQRAID
ncbi:DUF1194 domain-containing protein [Pelagibius sp. CAU 1746]|uniref:DUF1194 domain-containing protein n=1 Tax=Pelagibius sp. CAU 1746 TaxID=3140370 RepID=UPI00325A49E1